MGKENIKNAIDTILNDKKKQIDAKIDSVKQNIAAQLDSLKQIQGFTQYEIPPGLEGGSGGNVSLLHKFIQEISTADNQLNLINHLLEGLNNFCSRAALFLIKEEKFVGWKGKGFSKHGGGIGDEEIKKVYFSAKAATIFKHVLDQRSIYSGGPVSQPEDNLIYEKFGGDKPEKIFALPFFVKGKPQAVIYSDSFQGKSIAKREIEILSIVGEMSLDLLPLRQRILSRVKTREYMTDGEAPSPEVDVPQFEPDREKTAPPSTGFSSQDDNEITVPSVKESDPERLARVIINDIILYNKDKIEKGRQDRNLYKLLRDTIMQAKELYLIKYTDLKVFETQLVKQLANGDKGALQGYGFETI